MSNIRLSSNITKLQIIRLSIPIFFSNLAIPLVGLVDTALMGHMDNEKFLIAVSISTTFLTVIFWSFGFLRMGTVGLISQSLGKGDYRELVNIIFRNMFIAILIGLIIIFLKPFLLNILNLIFNTSEQTLNLINEYISIRVISAPAELIIYVIVGLFLGVQRTFVSSSLIITLSILNIILSIFFVTKLNMGVSGVAFGTLIAAYVTAISFALYMYYFFIKKYKVIPRIHLKKNNKSKKNISSFKY